MSTFFKRDVQLAIVVDHELLTEDIIIGVTTARGIANYLPPTSRTHRRSSREDGRWHRRSRFESALLDVPSHCLVATHAFDMEGAGALVSVRPERSSLTAPLSDRAACFDSWNRPIARWPDNSSPARIRRFSTTVGVVRVGSGSKDERLQLVECMKSIENSVKAACGGTVKTTILDSADLTSGDSYIVV